MSGRIVVFGATGYTGGLMAERLVACGRAPGAGGTLRRRAATLAESLGGLETAPAPTSMRQNTVFELVEEGDVLVSTVGPFAKWGEPARAGGGHRPGCGLHRLDRRAGVHPARVPEPRAGRQAAGVPLLTAMGYDFVPGALAGALALEEAARTPSASTSATTRSG